jgi:YfiH family protein
MQFDHVGERRYARFERLLAVPGLVHAVTTRPLDVSPKHGPPAAANRDRVARDLRLDPAHLRHCEQVHDTRLVVVDAATPTGGLAGCDGVATATPGIGLMCFSADCPLVLIADPARRVVAIVHASWRCTVRRIVMRMVTLLTQQWQCAPADLLADIGPGAGPCCYEVGPDVRAAAAGLPDEPALFPTVDGRMHFDLWAANRAQLIAAGVADTNIVTAAICTMCRDDLFFSFRREGTGCGHFGLIAGWADESAG